ncbi:MAG: hypothetical protein CL558_09405 [Alphaproteobacteria bacterium]|nr:hypothetical protein [Alphaproteobacteria bacterium]MAS46674.1 hypothetical protein [Alphaproteobacteria bacterium]MAX94769.1 hypothetical protein [Alphaproteobacteria bacterium]MBN53779.1 hypothetical protein [Alphaproteobacteria bacterium]OUT42660.1 MAG: hypothetical protein CBB62_05360 [Micavibrio sp. TMED2]|tara:strand:+ start:8950 stop:9822 length:873 start_codon:yes stop_codon:yes gene_type:complete
MIVACPACNTRYELPPSSISGEGRQVRCARCGNQWFLAKPEAAAPTPKAPQEDVTGAEQEVAVAESDDEVLVEEETEVEVEIETEVEVEEETEADTPAEPEEEQEDPWERRRRRAAAADDLPGTIKARPDMPDMAAAQSSGVKKAVGWLCVAALIAGTGFVGHFYRESIIEALPQSQVVYEALGYNFAGPLEGLELPEVTSTRSLENGSTVLVVEGKVANTSDQNKRLPTLRAELLDADDQVISNWTFTLDLGVVAAGAEVPFTEVLIDPDPRAVRVEVSLVDSAAAAGN